MPRQHLSQIELAKLARQHDPDMRVVVISGNPPVSALPDGVKFLIKAALSDNPATGGDVLKIANE